MMFVTLAVIPLLALMRKPRQPVPAAVGE
jgi:hypothetical protein